MTLLEHEGKAPRIDPLARIAPNAVICGDVTVGANTSVGFGAVLTAESGPIAVGANCVIMDTAVLRGVRGAALVIGDNVLVGPRACLTGCRVGHNVFIATGASVFNGAVIGAGAEVRINGVVHIRTVLAEGATVPIGWVAVGDPARILPPVEHDAIWAVQKDLDFPKVVFGVGRPPPGGSMMPDVMPKYAARLAGHRDDVEVG
ncbi:gamma carbonic anhydrase family protein [Minwuia thermotolerans]|uniref:Transferase n=1 Tax=Minwuia thermotolerans TaxID=2056226 RepID=A0A2M9G743_9PROT|nr:gamma carbonic anhydrase family protein [Minwuia thermotolerans]PJK31537.1 transferase [Minwuia thermotolerans]